MHNVRSENIYQIFISHLLSVDGGDTEDCLAMEDVASRNGVLLSGESPLRCNGFGGHGTPSILDGCVLKIYKSSSFNSITFPLSILPRAL